MSLTMHSASVPLLTQMLGALSKNLAKGAAFAEAKKIDPAVLLQSRLAPDMFPLVRQVQLVSDFAKGMVARLSGTENPRYEDSEASFADLKARLAKTLAFVQSVPASAFDGAEDRDLVIPAGPRTLEFKGLAYLLGYAILRHNGVDLGKADYIGPAA